MFLLPCLQERVIVWLLFYVGIVLKVLLPCELRILTLQVEQLLDEKIFWSLFVFMQQYDTISLKLWLFYIFFLSRTEAVIQDFSTMLYSSLYMTLLTFFFYQDNTTNKEHFIQIHALFILKFQHVLAHQPSSGILFETIKQYSNNYVPCQH